MPDWFWLSFVLLAALAAFMSLRVLAMYRQREVDRHDLAREVWRLRHEYERRMSDRSAVDAHNQRTIR